MTQLYLMPNGKIATQNGKPVLMEQDDFTECCCGDEFISYKFVQTGLTGGGLEEFVNEASNYYTYYDSSTFMGAGFEMDKGENHVTCKFNFEASVWCGGLPDPREVSNFNYYNGSTLYSGWIRPQIGEMHIKLNIARPLTLAFTASGFFNKTNYMISKYSVAVEYLYTGRTPVPNSWGYSQPEDMGLLISGDNIDDIMVKRSMTSDVRTLDKGAYTHINEDGSTFWVPEVPILEVGTSCDNMSTEVGWDGNINPYTITLQKGLYNIVLKSSASTESRKNQSDWFLNMLSPDDFDMTDIDFSRPVPTEVPYEQL